MNFDYKNCHPYQRKISYCHPDRSKTERSSVERSGGIYMNNRKSLLTAVIIFLFIMFLTRSASAAGLVPDACTGDATGCNLDQIFVLIATVGNYILGISGALALAMFVIGGFFMILSGYGGKGWNDKGKKMLTSAVVGLIIIFGSYLIVDFVLVALTTKGIKKTTDELVPAATVQPSAGSAGEKCLDDKGVQILSCGENQTCDKKTGTCVTISTAVSCELSGSGQCPSGQYCDSDKGICVAGTECSSNSNCPSTQHCSNGICVSGNQCAASGDCPSGYNCSPSLNYCVLNVKCAENGTPITSCPSGQTCNTTSGFCE